jgi:hypothetical protein
MITEALGVQLIYKAAADTNRTGVSFLRAS